MHADISLGGERIASAMNFLRRDFLMNTEGQYMKESYIFTENSTTNGSLAEHLMGIHEGVKYPCGQCGKQFSQKGARARHQRAAHEGIKYLCGKCDYQATAKADLAKHQRGVHEGVKYPCGHCGKQLSKKGEVVRHHKYVHKNQ